MPWYGCYWDGPAVHSGLNCWTEAGRREARLKEHAMRTSQKAAGIIATIGIDIGKNTFHLVGLDCGDKDRKSTRLNSSHGYISYAVFCLKKKKKYTPLVYDHRPRHD